MKRIYRVGTAVAALLTVAIATASASAAPAAHKPASVKRKPVAGLVPVKTSMTCSISLATSIPADDVTVTQGADSGTQFGHAGCGKPLFHGIEQTSFVQDESGDITGSYQQWFNQGSVYGAYTLTPQDSGPPTTTSFTDANFTGTINVREGTGLYHKATGTGTLSCSTTDLAHYTCTEKLSLVQQVKASVTPVKSRR